MKPAYYFILLLALLFSDCLSGGEDKQILEIRNQFKRWQQVLTQGDVVSQKLYHVYFGDYFDEDAWIDSSEAIGDRFVGEEVTVSRHEQLGISLKVKQTSPSGDWHITSEHYYWPSQKLFFVFWAMNTSQADEPVTVERRLYFNPEGEVIRRLESVYKMNSRVHVDVRSYAEQKITYWLEVDSIPFKDLIKNELRENSK